MKAKATDKIPTKNKIRIVVITALVLSVSLIAMQFTEEVKWDLQDFIVIGAILTGAGFLYELIAKHLTNPLHRTLLAIGVVLAVVIIWIELAVGIFD